MAKINIPVQKICNEKSVEYTQLMLYRLILHAHKLFFNFEFRRGVLLFKRFQIACRFHAYFPRIAFPRRKRTLVMIQSPSYCRYT